MAGFREDAGTGAPMVGMFITGYVVMPEHVHLLISEPERSTLAVAVQMLKQITGRSFAPPLDVPSGKLAIMTSTYGPRKSGLRSFGICIGIQ
jgi:REP element-mobilizing transposase RayT